MRRLVLPIAVLLAAVTACDSSEPKQRSQQPPPAPTDTAAQRQPPRDEPAPPRVNPSPEEQLIQAWLAALALEDYRKAASYFAPNAFVFQGEPFRLRTRANALAFNRGLTCSAHLTEIVDEGRTTLATFLLAAGPGGPCEGSVRVRFTIRDGKFHAFRQLLEQPSRLGVEPRSGAG